MKARKPKTLSEKIFGNKSPGGSPAGSLLCAASCFRPGGRKLVEACRSQVLELNVSQIAVRQRCNLWINIKEISSFSHINEGTRGTAAAWPPCPDPGLIRMSLPNDLIIYVWPDAGQHKNDSLLPNAQKQLSGIAISFCYVRATSPSQRSSCPHPRRLVCRCADSNRFATL